MEDITEKLQKLVAKSEDNTIHVNIVDKENKEKLIEEQINFVPEMKYDGGENKHSDWKNAEGSFRLNDKLYKWKIERET